MYDKLLRVADAAEQWEAARLRVRQRCEAEASALIEEIGGGLDRLRYRDLLWPGSERLASLGKRLRHGILHLEQVLAREISEGVEAEEGLRFWRGVLWTHIPSVAEDTLSGKGGLGLSEAIRLITGSSAAAVVARAGSRAAPTALAAAGLGAFVVPVTAAGSVLGLGLTTRSLALRKQHNLRQASREAIERIILGNDGHPSVLANHLRRVDQIYAPLLET